MVAGSEETQETVGKDVRLPRSTFPGHALIVSAKSRGKVSALEAHHGLVGACHGP